MSARATIVIPTYGEAPFLRWAIASAQLQTVHELEIRVICDGSPPGMIERVQALAREDPRIGVSVFPKGPRTGEAYRDQVLRESAGAIICYLSHDDLHLPWHVETMERALQLQDFVHSLHLDAATRLHGTRRIPEVEQLLLMDLSEPRLREIMVRPQDWWNFFGLTFAAHTRAAYLRLPEGWSTAPPELPTDLFMWRKFLAQPWCRCESVMEITALHFEKPRWRQHWSPERRESESLWWFHLMQEPGFREDITSLALRRVALDIALVGGPAKRSGA